MGRSALDRKLLARAEVMWQAPLVASDVVWWPAGPGASRGSVAALTVSYNTRELTAFLLWSLRTILRWPELEIVVVDNGSRDGSAQLLAEAERDGVCTLLANHGNRHHGPGLNQGISYLASRPGPRPFPFTAAGHVIPPRTRQPRRGPRRRGPLPFLLRVGRGPPRPALRRSSWCGPAIPRPATGIP